jgi:ketosteroid isomerase-like protein
MKRHIFAAVLLGLMSVARSLAAHETSASSAPTEEPSITLAPELDRVLRDFERAWQANDSEALAALFAEDGFVLQSNRLPARGRPAIQATYKGQGGGELRLRAIASAAGDTAGFIIGGYRYGNATRDMGKFTLTLRRSRGRPWQIFSDMDNLNAAPKSRSA